MLLERILRARGHQVTSCESAEQALEALQTDFFSLITLDIQLPGISGLDFARQLRSQPTGDSHYILVGTGNSRPEDLRAILDAGADDYIAKPYHPGLLDIRLSVAESAIKGISRRKALEAELLFLAHHDPLTGLMNRSGLGPSIDKAIAQAKSGKQGTLLYLDLDNFKIINDSLGHETGDDLLLKVAATLRRVATKKSSLIRFGGDEFVIVMPDCTTDEALAHAESLREALQEIVYVAQEKTLRVGASIGLAAIDGHLTSSEVMAHADEACYAAKANGRNCVEVHNLETGAIASLIADTDWSTRIKEAMVDGSLQVWYQPIMCILTGECFAQEMLVRYEEAGATISPAAFLSSLRRSGQMPRLDRFMITRAFEALALTPDLTVSINISGALFNDPDYCSFVESMIENSNISPRRVLFEITEDELISNLQSASGTIRRLQHVGCRFGLDDFGSGFSSLSYLKMLPIDFIKIDGSFTRDLVHEPFQQALIRAIKGISNALGVQTVAEFVETPEELALLREIGIDHAQGFFLQKPRNQPFTKEEIAASLGAYVDKSVVI
jgi:diguanylate cyclase (GGDEF)-like protein